MRKNPYRVIKSNISRKWEYKRRKFTKRVKKKSGNTIVIRKSLR